MASHRAALCGPSGGCEGLCDPECRSADQEDRVGQQSGERPGAHQRKDQAMKPQPCFETNRELERAARRAEIRKNAAIDRLNAKLELKVRIEQAMHDLVDAGERALQEKGK